VRAVSTLEQQVARLIAHQEIQQLAYRYAYAFDTRDRAMYESLFADVGDPRQYALSNRASVTSENTDLWFGTFGASVLFVCNHVIDLDDADHAHGAVYCHAQIQMAGSEGLVEQSICYQDRYVRIDGSWLFRDRKHLIWFGVETAERPFAQPPANWPERHVGVGTLPGDFPSYRRFFEQRPAEPGPEAERVRAEYVRSLK
jgi:hypothetical protein